MGSQVSIVDDFCKGGRSCQSENQKRIPDLRSETLAIVESVSALGQLKTERDKLKTAGKNLGHDVQSFKTIGEAAGTQLSTISARWESSQADMARSVAYCVQRRRRLHKRSRH
jgi:hypothetical protein